MRFCKVCVLNKFGKFKKNVIDDLLKKKFKPAVSKFRSSHGEDFPAAITSTS